MEQKGNVQLAQLAMGSIQSQQKREKQIPHYNP